MTAPQRSGPLVGMKVIELAHIMAGPVTGLMLADLGADVVKVEKVPGGDATRGFLPPDIDGECAAFMMMNRNKRGIALDLKHPEGAACLRRLLDRADVVIENYRRDTMDRLGLGYETLRQSNPGLIYCTISGFGRTGPYADRGGFDLIAQGMSGLMSITGEGPGRPPVKVGAPVTDITAGILGALGVVSAYAHKLQTGQGQMVDTSLFEAGITHTYWQSAIAFATGKAPGPMGSAHPINAPYQAYETADGWINVGAATERNWARLLEALDAEHLGEDPRFTDNHGRWTNLYELEAALAPYFKHKTTAAWLAQFEAMGLPAGPILNVAEMHADPQAVAREMVTEVTHSRLGPVQTIGLPIKLSETPGKLTKGAPKLNEDADAVLTEYGFSAAEIAALRDAGVFGD